MPKRTTPSVYLCRLNPKGIALMLWATHSRFAEQRVKQIIGGVKFPFVRLATLAEVDAWVESKKIIL